MSQTERVSLPSGVKIWIQENNGGSSEWIIDRVIGFGASCIVYRATQQSGAVSGRTGIVKEFYPQNVPGLRREGTALLIPEEQKALFLRKLARFENGFALREKHGALDQDHAMALPRIFGEANNTFYAVSDENTGFTLSELDCRELNLNRIAQILYSLSSAISALHEQRLLYLDCKPDNINVYTLDGREHVRLFDFDTVQSKAGLRESQYSTYSDGWAPSEQKAWRVRDISEKTDIYSLGAVFFWLLAGRKPVGDTYSGGGEGSDIARIAEGSFDWMRLPLCAGASEGVLALIRRICEKTLCVSPSGRYDSVALMQKDLQALMDKTGGSRSVEQELSHLQSSLAGTIRENQAESRERIERLEKKTEQLVDLLSGVSIAPVPSSNHVESVDVESLKFFTGEARAVYSDGGIYQGEWKVGARHGFGRYLSPDGRQSYVGDWEHDQRCGKGKLVDRALCDYAE